jgi:outer membrane protein assembly factor BamB
VLWKTDAWRLRIGVASPIDAGDGRVFISGGYNRGATMFQIVQQSDTFVPNVLFELRPEVFGSDQQTPIYYNGVIYGVRPDKQLVCMNPDGTIRWASGSETRYGLGCH